MAIDAGSWTPVQRPRPTSYLFVYNVVSALGWLFVLQRLLLNLLRALLAQASLHQFLSTFSFDEGSNFGKTVMVVQSFAVLEVFHSLFKLVKSNWLTTIMQVFSRVWIVWVILPKCAILEKSPFFASMVFAWSSTEVIRYSHYALNLIKVKSSILEWLRYSTFYPLYPIGAGSEAIIMFLASRQIKQQNQIVLSNVIQVLIALWPIALILMMTHMIRQRKKYMCQKAKAS